MLTRIVLVCTAIAVAAGAAVALLNDDGDVQEVAATAPPQDKPGFTAPGRPTTTELEPEQVERVEIRGRFGEACGENGLCYKVTRPHQVLIDALAENGWGPDAMPVIDYSISYQGEDLDAGGSLAPCQLSSTQMSYGASLSAEETEYGYRVAGTLPVNTPKLDLDGGEIHQLEADSTAAGGRVQIFVAELTSMTVAEFTELTQSHILGVDEVESHSGRPMTMASCSNWWEES